MSMPNLFLFAAPRAGSTQLAAWLTSHPEISEPGIKEPNHFSADDFPPDYVARTHLNDMEPAEFLKLRTRRKIHFAIVRDPGHYEALYDRTRTRWRLDASTSYLANAHAADRIALQFPEARAITLRRDPLERALSHYRLALRTGRTSQALPDEIQMERHGALPSGARYLIRPSRQTAQVRRVEAAFGPRHIGFQFEDITNAPRQTLLRIAEFLEVDPDGFDLAAEARNRGVAPRFPRLNAWAYRTGLKTRLRRNMPASWKPALKRLAFQDSVHAIPEAEIAALRSALADPDWPGDA